MEVESIPFRKTGYFSNLICDYLDEKEQLKPLYNRFPRLEAFKEQVVEKQSQFPKAHREILVKVLNSQYKGTAISKATQNNIASLSLDRTFTIVTGHQLNLFTGPLYFLYKIVSTINLTKELKKAYPDYNFVPVYWMATEDHDFEEINYFNFRGKKIQWNRQSTGAVGKLNNQGLEAVLELFSKEVGGSANAKEMLGLFRQSYLEHHSLSGATRSLANTLFSSHGLVIIDGDDKALKKLLVPYIIKDLEEKLSFSKVSESIAQLEELPGNYKIQVNPREINYFYLDEDLRERIVEDEEGYLVINTDLKFSKKALLELLEKQPERFSPNVITRPLYQEVILPNLCYIGGGGELAYWLELRAYFEAMEVPFPILLLRNSALIVSEKRAKKIEKLQLNLTDLFLKQSSFINKRIREISNIDIDFSPQKKHLKEQFEELHGLAAQTDKSFEGAVKAQEVKQMKGLEHLEKRLLKAQKRKLKDQVVRMTELQNMLFPNQSLQERNLNFSEVYLDLGASLIPVLIKGLQPLSGEFTVITTS